MTSGNNLVRVLVAVITLTEAVITAVLTALWHVELIFDLQNHRMKPFVNFGFPFEFDEAHAQVVSCNSYHTLELTDLITNTRFYIEPHKNKTAVLSESVELNFKFLHHTHFLSYFFGNYVILTYKSLDFKLLIEFKVNFK
jgi:hypothetical protein